MPNECILYIQLQIVNRIQKLWGKVAQPTDTVEVYFEYSLVEDKSISQRVLNSQVILSIFSFYLHLIVVCVGYPFMLWFEI